MNKPVIRTMWGLFLLGLPLLCGCGQTGPLTLPQPEKTQVNESL